jgi:hypothetical protein
MGSGADERGINEPFRGVRFLDLQYSAWILWNGRVNCICDLLLEHSAVNGKAILYICLP